MTVLLGKKPQLSSLALCSVATRARIFYVLQISADCLINKLVEFIRQAQRNGRRKQESLRLWKATGVRFTLLLLGMCFGAPLHCAGTQLAFFVHMWRISALNLPGKMS